MITGYNREPGGTLKGVALTHGRFLAPGQVWQSNDPRNLRAVRVISFHEIAIGEVDVVVENIITRRRTMIDARRFTTGCRGWHLMARRVAA